MMGSDRLLSFEPTPQTGESSFDSTHPNESTLVGHPPLPTNSCVSKFAPAHVSTVSTPPGVVPAAMVTATNACPPPPGKSNGPPVALHVPAKPDW